MSKKPPPEPEYVLRPNAAVNCLYFHTNELLLSGGLDGSISLWCLRTRRILFSFFAHFKSPSTSYPSIQTIKIISDNLITHGRDGAIKIWKMDDINSKNKNISPVQIIHTTCCHFCSVDFIELRKSLEPISSSNPLAETVPTQIVEEQEEIVHSFLTEELKKFNLINTQSSDKGSSANNSTNLGEFLKEAEHLIAVATGDSSIEIYNLFRTFKLAELQVPDKKVGMCLSIKFIVPPNVKHSKDLFVAATFEDGYLYLWSLMQENSPILLCHQIFSEPALQFCYNEDLNKGIIGGSINTISTFKFDFENLKIKTIKSIPLTQTGISSIAIRGDNKIFATGGWDHRVRIFSMKTNKPLAILKFHTETVQSVAFSPEVGCNVVATAGGDALIALWQIY